MSLLDSIDLFIIVMAVIIFAPCIILYSVYIFGNKQQHNKANKILKKIERIERRQARINKKKPTKSSTLNSSGAFG